MRATASVLGLRFGFGRRWGQGVETENEGMVFGRSSAEGFWGERWLNVSVNLRVFTSPWQNAAVNEGGTNPRTPGNSTCWRHFYIWGRSDPSPLESDHLASNYKANFGSLN
jgi:hypothetical protein